MAEFNSRIQVSRDVEAIRKRPGMFLGSTSSKGLHRMVYEIVDRAIDEVTDGFCSEISVTLHADGSCSVQDNGRGGHRGFDASVVIALSAEFCYRSVKTGSFIKGTIVEQNDQTGKSEERGLFVKFKPDPEIFTETTVFDYDTLLDYLRKQAFLNAGVRIIFRDERVEPAVVNDLCYERGIASFVDWLNEAKHGERIHPQIIEIKASDGDITLDLAFQYNSTYSDTLMSFANNIHTMEGGMHEGGFKVALNRVLNEFGRKLNLLGDDDWFDIEDTMEGICAVVSVRMDKVCFEGMYRTKLANPEVRGFVDDAVTRQLTEFMEENPAVCKAILEKAMSAAKARKAVRYARELIRRKVNLDSDD